MVKKFGCILLTIVGLSLVGCKVTVKAYEILYSHRDSQLSSSASEDNVAGLYFALKEDDVVLVTDDYLLKKGPYKLIASVGIREHVQYGKPKQIEVKKAELTIFYKEGEQRKYDISPTQKKTEIADFIGLSFKEEVLEINYERLEKVEYFVEFSGSYEDGTKREYWIRSYAFPNYRKERFNPYTAH